MRVRLPALVGGLLILASACSTQPTTSPAASPTGTLPAQAPGDCEAIMLRDPNGAQVDLTGEWRPDPDWDWISVEAGEQAFILQTGNCVWMTVTDSEFRSQPRPGESYLGQFEGRLSPNFAISGTLVTVLHWTGSVAGWRQRGVVFPVQLQIRWDCDGRICLHEVRQDDSRCVYQQVSNSVFCPPESILHRVEDLGPAGSPST